MSSQALPPVKSKATTQELEATTIEPTALTAGVSHEAHMKAALEKYDTDGDGVYSKNEVKNIIEHVDSSKQEAKNMKGVAMGSMLLAAVCVGLMYGVNEASKENHIKSDGNGIASELDLAGKIVHTQNSETQTEITIGETTVLPILRGEDPAMAERAEVGSVARTAFFNGLNEVKSSSRKGTAKYNKGAGHKMLFDYTITEVTEDQKAISLAVEVDMPGGIRQFAVACAKGATKCPIFALVSASGASTLCEGSLRSLAGHGTTDTSFSNIETEFDRSLGSKGPAPGTRQPSTPAPAPAPKLVAWSWIPPGLWCNTCKSTSGPSSHHQWAPSPCKSESGTITVLPTTCGVDRYHRVAGCATGGYLDATDTLYCVVGVGGGGGGTPGPLGMLRASKYVEPAVPSPRPPTLTAYLEHHGGPEDDDDSDGHTVSSGCSTIISQGQPRPDLGKCCFA